jgi:hypothetical protein
MDKNTSQKTSRALNRSADQLRLRSLARHGVLVLLEAKREIDLRLTKNPSEPAGKQPGESASNHAPDQKPPHHRDGCSVARKA